MNRIVSLAVAALALASASPVPAQEAAAPALPEICTRDAAAMGMGTPAPMAGGHAMDEAHAELMATMEPMHGNMMVGMMAADIDVAFVCGMIPHHQGAIDMAKVQLARGDDPWAREMAQKVIDAQTQEIADMLAWLEQQQ